MDDKEKARYDKSQLPFKTYPRFSFGCSVLCLPRHYKIIEEPSFVCNGILKQTRFQVSEKVLLLGVGFLGPIEGDTQFHVTVQLRRYNEYSDAFESGTLEKSVFARKGKIFYFLFDEPITMEPNKFDISWDYNSYYIDYNLKGANNVSQYKVETRKVELVQISGVNVDFHVDSQWYDGKPLAELLFKKI